MIGAAALTSAASTLPGCATTGSTLGSGVGDALREHPPFYAGRLSPAGSAPAIGYLPVVYQRGASQAPIFDPTASEAMQALLTRMTAYLDSLGVGPLLAEGGRVSAVTHAETRRPPDVILGCVTDFDVPDEDCADRGDGAAGRGSQPMRLAVTRPSPEWQAWANELMLGAGVDQLLVVTVEVGQYWVRQRGLRGTKVVELGTDHVVTFPWLTGLDAPVAVVQVTGALVGRNGKATRIGGEGMSARRTSMTVGALGAQSLITDQEIEELLVARREDVAGTPLVWQQALRSLVAGLTGRGRAAVPGA